MSMVIDSHVLVGKSIFGYQLEPEELLAVMDKAGIDLSIIIPVQPKTYHLNTENDYISELVKKYPNKFLGFSRVDPRQGTDAHKELERAVLKLGLRGLFLEPWEEGYRINDDDALSLVQFAETFNIPVMIAAGYPWVSHALQIGEVARRCPNTSIIMTNGGQINISGLAQADAYHALKDNENLSIETSGLYRQDFIEDVIRDFGAHRVVFGSGSPKMNQEFELYRAQSATHAPKERERVLGSNMAFFLKL